MMKVLTFDIDLDISRTILGILGRLKDLGKDSHPFPWPIRPLFTWSDQKVEGRGGD